MNQNQKFKVKEFEWFEMQTRVRQMIQQLITPIQKRILQHSTNMAKYKQTQQADTLKVQQLTLMITGDPKIFQIGIFRQVDKRFEVHEKSLEQMRRLIEESNTFVDKKFDLLDCRMKQTNELMLNFVSLKQRVNAQIEMQNSSIQQIRMNLQKMISKVNQDIGLTNEKIVENLMVCEKMDKSLQERIRANENAIEINKDAIERNKVGIVEKNVQLETHEFKIDKIFDKLKELDRGHSFKQKMQQYMKDMEIAIRKCEFRVEAVTPLVTMAQLQQALQYILPQKLRKKIIIFGYKKYNKLNRQILDKNYDQVSEKFNGMQLVQVMQKKNMRQVTSLKRKKIISMGIDIDHLTFQARERYYQEVDMDELSNQEEDDQNIAKIDQAEILNLVSLYFNQFTTDVSQKVKNELQDTKAYLYGMQSQLKKQMQMNYNKTKKSQQQCMQFHRDQMLEMKVVMNQLQSVEENRKLLENWLSRGQEVEKKFYNFCSLINHLQIQQEIDKQNISLMGLQENRSQLEKNGNLGSGSGSGNGIMNGTQHQKNSIIELSDKCFSCCGYPASVLSSFKMACLAYHPSGIVIDGRQYKREDVLQFTTNLLQTIKSSLQLNNSGVHNSTANNTVSNEDDMNINNTNSHNNFSTDRSQLLKNNNQQNHQKQQQFMNKTAGIHSRQISRQKHYSGLDTLQRLGNNSRLQYLVSDYTNNDKTRQHHHDPTKATIISHDTISKLPAKQQNESTLQPQIRAKSSSMRMRRSVKKNPVCFVDQRKSVNNNNHNNKLRSITCNNNTSLSGQFHNSNNNNSNSMSKQMLTVTNNFIQLKKKHLNYLN